ncbi:hypothetical protein [Streptodolium elevatio]|uniref:Uncharacterized protein n=1 Tax=Streptodolium elevatio TaxID=3157996 RepID=A0ABV3DQB5_9ACTN
MADRDGVSQETHDGISAAAAALNAANAAQQAGDSEREMSERVQEAQIRAELNSAPDPGIGLEREA